jgi:hypothetical protein
MEERQLLSQVRDRERKIAKALGDVRTLLIEMRDVPELLESRWHVGLLGNKTVTRLNESINGAPSTFFNAFTQGN